MRNPKDNELVDIKVPRWFAKHIFALAAKHNLMPKYTRDSKAELKPMPKPQLRVVQNSGIDVMGQLERLSIGKTMVATPDDEPPRPAA